MYKTTQNDFSSDRLGAYVDAINQSKANRELWPANYIKGAEFFAERAKAIYPESRVFFNIRKKWLAVKVEDPGALIRNSEAVRNFDWYAANSDIDIVETRTGVIYRLRDTV